MLVPQQLATQSIICTILKALSLRSGSPAGAGDQYTKWGEKRVVGKRTYDMLSILGSKV